MTREIKFRAWDKKEKKMIYDHQITTIDADEDEHYHNIKILPSQNKGYYLQVTYRDEFYIDGVEEYKGIIMEFTGLRDKNEVDIYEKDIIKDVNYISPAFSSEYYRMEKIYDVVIPEIYIGWPEYGFEDFNKLRNYFKKGNKKNGCAVIGNTIENKELLKKN